MVTPNQHLHQVLSDPTFCNLTGLSEGILNAIRCDTCKATIVHEGDRIELIEHMLFGVLKITHEIYSRMRIAPPGFPLEQPSIIVPDTGNEENKGEVEVRIEETPLSVRKH